MFPEMVDWAEEDGADIIKGDTYYYTKDTYFQMTALIITKSISSLKEDSIQTGT